MNEKCDHEIELNEEFDAKFCVKCDEWIEKRCPDPTCSFCVNRPNKPSMLIKEKNETD